MFNIGDCVYVGENKDKHYTITDFYISVTRKECAYIKPLDGIRPEFVHGYTGVYTRGDQCGVLIEKLTHTKTLTPDWEI